MTSETHHALLVRHRWRWNPETGLSFPIDIVDHRDRKKTGPSPSSSRAR